jgi:hypothetical protein
MDIVRAGVIQAGIGRAGVNRKDYFCDAKSINNFINV